LQQLFVVSELGVVFVNRFIEVILFLEVSTLRLGRFGRLIDLVLNLGAFQIRRCGLDLITKALQLISGVVALVSPLIQLVTFFSAVAESIFDVLGRLPVPFTGFTNLFSGILDDLSRLVDLTDDVLQLFRCAGFAPATG